MVFVKPHNCTFCSDDKAFQIKIEFMSESSSESKRVSLICQECSIETLFMHNPHSFVPIEVEQFEDFSILHCDECREEHFTIGHEVDPQTGDFTGKIYFRCFYCDNKELFAEDTIHKIIETRNNKSAA
ncbi:hypothetical protein LCGC14_0174710 [marine sediment metagenome]|uniref:Uncharacterized protein n=1 Tax=marine sediment metagenome TaxID=412755 RepID=A0A0F9V7A9_9ZZZZ